MRHQSTAIAFVLSVAMLGAPAYAQTGGAGGESAETSDFFENLGRLLDEDCTNGVCLERREPDAEPRDNRVDSDVIIIDKDADDKAADPAESPPAVEDLIEGQPTDDATTDDATTDETAPDEGAPVEIAPDEAAPDEAAPDEATPDEATPDEWAPVEIAPGETPPDEATPDDLAPDDLAPDEAIPDEATPDDVAPDQAAPDQAAPDDVAPDQAAPDQVAPDETPPDAAPIERTAPNKTPAGDAAAGDEASAIMAMEASVDDIADVLEEEGYRVEKDIDSQGDPMLKLRGGSTNSFLYFYSCSDDEICASMQFSAGYDFDDGVEPETALQWNREKRYAKVFLDDDKDPFVQMDVVLNGGVTRENLRFWASLWRDLLFDFETMTNWR